MSRWTCGLLVAAGLAHGAFWLHGVRQLEALVGEQARALRAQGWRVVLGPGRPQGWPAHAGLQFGPASVEAAGLAWHADRATIDAPLRWPESVSATNPGPIRMRADGQQVRLGSGAILAVASPDLQLGIADGVATLAGTNVGIAPAFEAGALLLRLGPEGLALSARRLKPLDTVRMPGRVVDALALHASATPPFPSAGDLRSAAAAWRGAGGAVEVSEVTFTMGSAHAVGHGRIELDDALQPRLNGTVHVTGYEAGLDELAAAGVLARQTVVAAKAVLGLLAAPAPDGGADVPVEVAGGVLTVARFPLLRVPGLEWQAAPPEP